MTYCFILILLLLCELLYFLIADRFNIIDKPTERSSHSTVVLRGGGVIFPLSMLVWAGMLSVQGEGSLVLEYLPFLIGLVLISAVSFVDDVRSLPDWVRLVVQFSAMGLMFWNLDILHPEMWWVVLLALLVFVGATNIFNFMDGINGITAGYSLVVLLPLVLMNAHFAFIPSSLLMVAIAGVLVFAFFNFRPRGKAKCFAGDVGSVSIAFILLFAIGKLVMQTGDVTYLIFLLVYGVDGCCTILHRIQLHENLGQAHRKHAYQLMANELGMSHVSVSLIYMALQAVVSLGFVFLCPNTLLAHWIYLGCALVLLIAAYVVFMKKNYWRHEAYLEGQQAK